MNKTIWTKEKCKEEASKYSSRKEFQKGNSAAYNVALRNKWLNEWFTAMTNKCKWTYERCKEEAKKYSSRNEFEKAFPSAYQTARKNHWLDEFFDTRPKKSPYWNNYEKCYEDNRQRSRKQGFNAARFHRLSAQRSRPLVLGRF